MEKLNPYTARVDRSHPTAFIFLIDQSGSMEEEVSIDGKITTKQELVADSVNKLLDELINRCTKPEEIRHYFDIALIGYGADKNAEFISFGDKIVDDWLTPEDLKKYARYKKVTIEQNIRGTIKTREVDVPYWVEPLALYRTPMHNAFSKAKGLMEEWCESKLGQDCYPPVLINITDGLQTDAENEEMIEIAKEIMQLNTIDGNVLVFNIHLSDMTENSIAFPTSNEQVGEDSYSQMLYEMSSVLPKMYNSEIEKIVGRKTDNGFRAMGYNQSVQFVNMLNIGTITNMAENNE